MSGGPQFGEALLRIAPDKIHIPQRLGLYFPDKAEALGTLMAIHGQRTPITVRASSRKIAEAGQPWTLIVGMHRTHGAMLKGLELIALERIGGTAADALDEEASENLDRREQPPLERAIFIHATCEAAKLRLAGQHGTINQHRLGAKARWAKVKAGELRLEQALQEEGDDACDTMSQAYGWAESVAAAFGRDKRAIYRALALYRMVVEPFPELTQALSDHPVVGGNAAQLKLIAQVRDEGQRRQVIDLLLADRDLSAEGARVMAGIDAPEVAAPTKDVKFTSTISDSWGRLSMTARREYLPRFVGLLTPDLKVRLGELLGDNVAEARLKGALKETFDVIARLALGEPVDDGELEAARRVSQLALFGIDGE